VAGVGQDQQSGAGDRGGVRALPLEVSFISIIVLGVSGTPGTADWPLGMSWPGPSSTTGTFRVFDKLLRKRRAAIWGNGSKRATTASAAGT
jgi:hypothetical protein